MDNDFLLTFEPIMNAPWAIDGRRRVGIEGTYFVVKGMTIGDISWLDVYSREENKDRK